MTLADFTLKLQTLCHAGHSLDEVVVYFDDKTESYIGEVKQIYCSREEQQICLLSCKKKIDREGKE